MRKGPLSHLLGVLHLIVHTTKGLQNKVDMYQLKYCKNKYLFII